MLALLCENEIRSSKLGCHAFAGGNFILCQIQKMACANT